MPNVFDARFQIQTLLVNWEIRGNYMRSPAGVMMRGIINATSRASGSNIPLFLRACHSAILSVNPPPQYAPRKVPRREGMLMRPLIAGVILYGGDWKITH